MCTGMVEGQSKDVCSGMVEGQGKAVHSNMEAGVKLTCITVFAGPAQTTGTRSRGRITQTSITAVTAIGTACTIPAWGTAYTHTYIHTYTHTGTSTHSAFRVSKMSLDSAV